MSRILDIPSLSYLILNVGVITLCAYLGARKVLYITDEGILIKGIFRKMRVAASELKSIHIRKNFICRVFDWHLVEIERTEGTVRVYTREINRERIEALLSSSK